MDTQKNIKNPKIYIFITILIIITLIYAIFFGTAKNLKQAYVKDQVLKQWSENIEKRDTGQQLLGLEKWGSFTYENNKENNSAFLIVTTFKSILPINENELKEKTQQLIKKQTQKDIIKINQDSLKTDKRTLKNGHQTQYFIYNGTDPTNNKKIKTIGEVWNCGKSGVSVICIGMAHFSENNTTPWAKIVSDEKATFGKNYRNENGLIYNIVCH